MGLKMYEILLRRKKTTEVSDDDTKVSLSLELKLKIRKDFRSPFHLCFFDASWFPDKTNDEIKSNKLY